MTTGGFDPRLTSYFGDATLQAGFLPVPHLFLRHYAELGISGQQAMFIIQLMASAWDLGSPPTTLSDIARRMGIARRTAQAISAELHANGILEIYDQYDDGGAQIENGYDLGPLFQRLAAFAPATKPSGTQRQRRTVTDRARVHDQCAAQPLAATITPPWQDSASPPGKKQHPPLDQAIQPPQQESARLNEESKNLRKNTRRKEQEQQREPVAATEIGRSLRLDKPLSASEVHTSRQLLAKIGINADVADAVAPVLHPAETWALWLHARACRLRPGWIAMQVYDSKKKQPRMAGIPAPYEQVGHLLVEHASVAPVLVDIVDRYCPGDRATALTTLEQMPAITGDAWHEPFDAVWAAMAAERHGRAAQDPEPAPAEQAREIQHEDARWEAVQQHLGASIAPTEYTTWIDPLKLVQGDDELVVIAVPNVFVRSEIQSAYMPALEEALQLAWGKAMVVEFVIEQALAA